MIMRKMKKFLCAALASTMVLAMAAPSFAAQGDPGTITIENAIIGQSYNVYKLLDAIQNQDGSSWAYTVNVSWAAFFATDEAKAYFTVDSVGNVAWKGDKSEARVKDFASLALTYAKANVINPVATQNKVTAPEVTFDGLGLGYFLLDSSAGTLLSLDTNSPSKNIKEKNEAPAVPSKSVTSIINGNTNMERVGELTSVSIGDTINYRIVIDAKEGAENYVLHDDMDEGLIFNVDSVQVYKVSNQNAPLDVPVTPENNYEVVTNNLCGEGCDFEVKFTSAFCTELKKEDFIIVTYSTKFAPDGTVNSGGYNNKAHLTYGNGGTTPDNPGNNDKVFTFDMPVLKYTGTLDTNGDIANGTGLAGAVFTLSANADGKNPIKITGNNGAYRVAKIQTGDVTPENSQMITPEAGTLKIDGLAAGTYYLTEVTAPAGYNKLEAPITVIITATVTGEGETAVVTKTMYEGTEVPENATNRINVLNNTGSLLPSTGGIGTTIFYAAGIILMAGAVFFVVRRKRA